MTVEYQTEYDSGILDTVCPLNIGYGIAVEYKTQYVRRILNTV